jgi:hypothetical protein
MLLVLTNLFIKGIFFGLVLTFEVEQTEDKTQTRDDRQNDDSNEPKGSIGRGPNDVYSEEQSVFTHSIKLVV